MGRMVDTSRCFACSLCCTYSTGARLAFWPNLRLDSISEVYEQNEKSFEDVVWVGDVNYWNLLKGNLGMCKSHWIPFKQGKPIKMYV